MEQTHARPADFDSYWQGTLDELAHYPARPEVEVIPIRSTDFATVYGIRLTSLGPYRLFAYLSVPLGQGPFPAIYYASRYSSVVEPVPQGAPNLARSRYVTLSIASRGQRNADQPFAALFPGLLTEGIDDPATYVFRGIAADCVRGLEILLARREVDSSRVAGVGNDMALITAALHGGITHLVCTPGLFYDTARLAPETNAYPLEEINDYLRLHPRKRGSVKQTLSYFDPRWFASKARASTLLLADAPGGLLDRQALAPLTQGIEGQVTVHDSERSSYKDGLFTERWLTQQLLGEDVDPILPEAWR